jgi:ferredoxin
VRKVRKMTNLSDSDWTQISRRLAIETSMAFGMEAEIHCGKCGDAYPARALHYCEDDGRKATTVYDQDIAGKPEWPAPPARGRRVEEAQKIKETIMTGRLRCGEPHTSASPQPVPIGVAGKCLNCFKVWNVSGVNTMKALRCPDCEGFVITPSGRVNSRVFWSGEEEALAKLPVLE